MTVSHLLHQLLLQPLELIFEFIYSISLSCFHSSGLSIFCMSLAMNLLLLPLYRRADVIQEEERAIEKRLEPGVAHIKKAFQGDERFMMLQAYYRKNDYKPYYSLKGSLPLVLEIPFFLAAYRFLSNLEQLRGTSFGPIADLGAPDGLLTVGGVTLSLLPILMTLINFISSAIYTKGLPKKDKLQLYAMALVFLVLLYRSPSGLVLYWTLNNLFSLVKNLVVRILSRSKRPKALPHPTGDRPALPADARLFWAGALLLTVLTGILIPSAVVSSSPAEFIHVVAFRSPLVHILDAFLLAAGFFLIWLGLFFFLANSRWKRVLSAVFWIGCLAALVNYMVYQPDLGLLSDSLVYEYAMDILFSDKLKNLLLLLALAAPAFWLWRKNKGLVRSAYLVLTLAVLGMSAVNCVKIQSSLPAIRQSIAVAPEEKATIPLSRNGKNVVVLMLDRAIGSYPPYLFREKPELAEQFAGFTYYPNTASFGAHTNLGSPGLFGGYEYTPEEMNKRADTPLVVKHNEALKVMPVLFSEAGFEVTVCDPSYAGYGWIPDLSIYADYPEIRTFLTESGQFLYLPESFLKPMNDLWARNFFCYSLMRISPLLLRPYLYSQGKYGSPVDAKQFVREISYSRYGAEQFISSYAVLRALPEITQISDSADNTFLMMSNSATHSSRLLQEPDYVPEEVVDNREYDAQHWDRFTLDGVTMRIETPDQMEQYHINMAAMLQLGAWFDYLRDNGVYDNTRIILVADHGYYLGQFDSMRFGTAFDEDAMLYNPLLMVKDFDSQTFTTVETLMTNADTPALAAAGLIDHPVNPFTGNPISTDGKNVPELHISASHEWDTDVNNGNTFLPGIWLGVHDDVRVGGNWRVIGEY